MTLQGKKADGTDLHSKTASLIGISRDEAKVRCVNLILVVYAYPYNLILSVTGTSRDIHVELGRLKLC